MSAPAWIEPFLTWLTSNPITTTALRRIEGNTKHLRDGNTVFSGTKQFTNNVEMLSQLIVRAETILREIVQISGSFSMLGNMTVDPRPGFGGTGNVTVSSGNVQLSSGNLTVTSGNATIGGNVTVSGNAVIEGSIDVQELGGRVVSSVVRSTVGQDIVPSGVYYAHIERATTAASAASLRISAPGAIGSQGVLLDTSNNIPTNSLRTSAVLLISDGTNVIFEYVSGPEVTLQLLDISP